MRWTRSWLVAACALLVWLWAASPAVAAGPTISLGGNLNGSASPGDVVEVDARFLDQLGGSYLVTFRFVNFGWGGWDWDVASSDPGVVSADPLGAGTLIFDVDGTAIAFPGSPEGLLGVELSNGTRFTGADAISVEMG